MGTVWGNGLLRKTEAAIGNRDNEIGSENTISRGLHGPRVFAMDVTVPFCPGLSDAAGGVGCAPFFFFSLGSLSLFFTLVATRMVTCKTYRTGQAGVETRRFFSLSFCLLLLRLVAPWSGC